MVLLLASPKKVIQPSSILSAGLKLTQTDEFASFEDEIKRNKLDEAMSKAAKSSRTWRRRTTYRPRLKSKDQEKLRRFYMMRVNIEALEVRSLGEVR